MQDAVEALRSRVAVYFGDWDKAKTAAEAVINSGNYEVVDSADFATTFNKYLGNTNNVLFKIVQLPTDNKGINGLSYIYRGTNYGDIEVNPDVLNIFDTTDVRYQGIAYDGDGKLRNMIKYPDLPNFDYDIPLIRYEEVILNYAEALLETGDAANALTYALTYLNMIPAKRGAHLYAGVTKDSIMLERRKELMFEGFRYDDMMRAHMNVPVIDHVGNVSATLTYGDYKMAFPIPRAEVNANKNMVQNYGY